MADLSTTKIYGDLTVSNNIKGYRIANLDDISVIYENRSITAGNGLSGGGALSNNLTISMGTPTGLTASTTNALTATSHTHSIATATAVGLSNSSVSGVGTSTSLARADHTHAITGFSLDTHNHTLDSLSNVTISSIASGEILKWNGTAWINNTLAEAGIQPAGSYLTTSSSFGGDVSGTYNNIVVADDSHNHIISNIDGLQTALDGKQPTGSYLTTATGFGGDVSGTYNAIVVANDSHTHTATTLPSTMPPSSHALDSHSNVTITSNTAGEILKWNGTAWVNNTLAEAGIQPAGSYLTTSSSFGGDVSGTYNAIVVADDSHNHIISNVDGLSDALAGKQSADADLTAIAGLTGTTGFLKKTAANTWILDNTTNKGTVTSVAAGNGMNFTTFSTTGTITMGTPSTLSASTDDATTSTSHTHAITATDSGSVSTIVKTGSDGSVTAANTFNFGTNASMVYNSTSKTIDFVFA